MNSETYRRTHYLPKQLYRIHGRHPNQWSLTSSDERQSTSIYFENRRCVKN